MLLQLFIISEDQSDTITVNSCRGNFYGRLVLWVSHSEKFSRVMLPACYNSDSSFTECYLCIHTYTLWTPVTCPCGYAFWRKRASPCKNHGPTSSICGDAVQEEGLNIDWIKPSRWHTSCRGNAAEYTPSSSSRSTPIWPLSSLP